MRSGAAFAVYWQGVRASILRLVLLWTSGADFGSPPESPSKGHELQPRNVLTTIQCRCARLSLRTVVDSWSHLLQDIHRVCVGTDIE